jgi:hypothetical protein
MKLLQRTLLQRTLLQRTLLRRTLLQHDKHNIESEVEGEMSWEIRKS